MYKIILLLSLAFLGYIGLDYSQEMEEPVQIAINADIPPFREVVYLTAENDEEGTKEYYSLNSEPSAVIGCRCLQNGISNHLLPFEVGWRS